MGTSQRISQKILVLVGPPGVGKKFCTLRLNGNHPMDVEIIKTVTTQPQRHIHDSLFYRTVSLEEFQRRTAEGEWLVYDEFAAHWYGVDRKEVETVLKQKHGVVSMTPTAADALRTSGLPAIFARLVPTSTALVEDNLLKKHEAPERLPLLRQASAMYDRLPESSFDVVVRVKTLVDAARELDEQLQGHIALR
jgi:guanylate kinase